MTLIVRFRYISVNIFVTCGATTGSLL